MFTEGNKDNEELRKNILLTCKRVQTRANNGLEMGIEVDFTVFTIFTEWMDVAREEDVR